MTAESKPVRSQLVSTMTMPFFMKTGCCCLKIRVEVCPTTIRYPGSYVIDGEGQIADYYPHTSRDRH